MSPHGPALLGGPILKGPTTQKLEGVPMDRRLRGGFLAIVVLGAAFSAQAEGQGTLVAATAADPQHFNPGITTASHTHAVADSLFNGLVALGRSAEAVPDLAQ